MLQGQYKHTVDSKNRMFVPAKFREELGETFVIAKSASEKCIRMMTSFEWEKYLSPFKELHPFEAERWLVRFNKTACQVTPDSQGRIVLTPDLMKYAGITKNAVIVGGGDFAEIWSEERHEIINEAEEEDDGEELYRLFSIKR